jgi:hypothetical protein
MSLTESQLLQVEEAIVKRLLAEEATSMETDRLAKVRKHLAKIEAARSI